MDKQQTYRSGSFRFGDDGAVVEGITDGSTWNGWANVWVDSQTLDVLIPEIRESLARSGRTLKVTKAGHVSTGATSVTFTETNENGEQQSVDLPAVRFEDRTFFGLVDGWTWEEVSAQVECPRCKGHGYVSPAPDLETPCGLCNGWGSINREEI